MGNLGLPVWPGDGGCSGPFGIASYLSLECTGTPQQLLRCNHLHSWSPWRKGSMAELVWGCLDTSQYIYLHESWGLTGPLDPQESHKE